MRINDIKLVYFSEFIARFSSWTVLSGLLIHITRMQWVTMPKALYILGASMSLLYLSSILGGIINDRFFNEKQTIILGIFLLALGSIALSFSGIFYIGLGTLFIGAGMVTPTGPLLLSKLLDKKNENDRTFTIFYGMTNSGIILGPIVGGFIEQYFSWIGVIIVNEIFIVTLLMFVFFNSWLKSLTEINCSKYIKFFILLLCSNSMIYLYLRYQSISKYILIVAVVGYLIFLIWLIKKFQSDRDKIIFSIILTLFAIVFFSGEFQVASSLITYADNFVCLKQLTLEIPASSLVALESAFVLIGTFLVTKTTFFSNIKFTQTKVFFGLMFCAAAFFVLYISTQTITNNKISLLWIIIPSFLLGIGEVILMPPIISYIANISPDKFKGRLMSGMYFALSISGYFSGLIAESVMHHKHFSSSNLNFYSTIFIMIAVISIGFGVLITIFRFNSMKSLGILQ